MTDIIDLSKIPANQQTEELCIEAINQNYFNLRYVKNQTDKICLAAVERDGWALQYVKNQTPEICLAAVKHQWLFLEFVKDQTTEICLEAVKNNGFSIMYSKLINDEIFITFAIKEKHLVFNDCRTMPILLKKERKGKTTPFLKSVINKIKNSDYKSINLDNSINGLTFCAEILSEQMDDFIVNLKNKIPEIFEENIELMSIYEKVLLNQTINGKLNLPLKFKNKKL